MFRSYIFRRVKFRDVLGVFKDLITFKITQNRVFSTPGIDLGGAQVIAYAWVGRCLTNRLCLLSLIKMGITFRSGIGLRQNWYHWKANLILYNLVGLNQPKYHINIELYSFKDDPCKIEH